MQYDNNFYDERDLVEHLDRGCEVEFLYEGKQYSITHINKGVIIGEFYNEESERIYPITLDILNYKINDTTTLKDIIDDMKVIDRSF